MKTVLHYTEKEYSGFKKQTFSSKKEALEFIEKNKEKFYWHQLIILNAKSKKELPLVKISRKELLEKYIEYTGYLDFYFETGMECTGLIFVKDGPEEITDLSRTIFISQLDIIKIDSDLIGLIKDGNFAADDGFRLSFYPRGFNIKEWTNLFKNKTKVTYYKRK